MEFIRTLREKKQARIKATIMQQSEDVIQLSDFNNEIFISYSGTPLMPIDNTMTPKDIVNKLAEIRQYYVNSRMKKCGLPKIAAAL